MRTGTRARRAETNAMPVPVAMGVSECGEGEEN